MYRTTEERRMLTLETSALTQLTTEKLIPYRARVTEAISTPFHIEIDCFSRCCAIKPIHLLSRNVTLTWDDGKNPPRYFNGVVERFSGQAVLQSQDGQLRHYRLIVVPTFTLLKQQQTCQIFTDLTIPEIFQNYSKACGYFNYKVGNIQEAQFSPYEKLPYKIQFNETAFAFLSRILEEAGISYYFYQSATTHTMMLVGWHTQFDFTGIKAKLFRLSDSPDDIRQYGNELAGKSLSEAKAALEHPRIFEFGTCQRAGILQTQMGPVHNDRGQWDYPRQNHRKSQQHVKPPYNQRHFDYPQAFQDGKARERLQDYATYAEEWQLGNSTRGASNYSRFGAGSIFSLDKDPDFPEGNYLITAIVHEFHDYIDVRDALHVLAKRSPTTNQSDVVDEKQLDETPQGYENRFCYLNTKAYRYAVKRSIPKPNIPNLQVAQVVKAPKAAGKFAEDTCADDLGRVYVNFVWDIKKTAIPLRCHQSIAGKQYSGQFIPRIGQEVLVNYIGGDCDMPLIVKAVPNDELKPAFDLEKNPNLNWIKTNSLKTNQDPNQGNHILFDDTAHKEQLQLQAQKDYLEDTLNDNHETIEGNSTVSVGGNHSVEALHDGISLEAKTIILRGGGSEVRIDDTGIHLLGSAVSGGRVNLRSKGAGEYQPVVRLHDKHKCPKHTAGIAHKGGKIISAATGIHANEQGIARQGDKLKCHIEKTKIKKGISSILVDGKPIARLKHETTHGGKVIKGSPSVYVGEKPYVQPLVPKPINPPRSPCTVLEFRVRCSHDKRCFELKPLDESPDAIAYANWEKEQHHYDNLYLKHAKLYLAGLAAFLNPMETPELLLAAYQNEYGIAQSKTLAKLTKGDYLLEVIAKDSMPDNLHLFFEGNCWQHPSRIEPCPQLQVTDPTSKIQHLPGTSLLSVYGSSNDSVDKDLLGFIKQIFLPNEMPQRYTIIPMTCLKTYQSVYVDAYAPVEWSGDLSVKYYFKQEDAAKELRDRYNAMIAKKQGLLHADYKFSKHINEELSKHGTWEVHGGIEVKRNNSSWSIGKTMTKEGQYHGAHPASDILFKSMKGILDKITPVINSISAFNHIIGVDLKMPELGIKGKIKNKEISEKFDVGLEGEVSLCFDPLFEVDVTFKVLNWLIAFAGPGLGTFLLHVKEELESGVGDDHVSAEADANINFVASGFIKGEVTWSKAQQQPWKIAGNIAGGVELKLVGEGNVHIHVFIVKAAAGAMAYAASTLSLHFIPCIIPQPPFGDPSPGVELQFKFTGLTVFYVVYWRVGIKKHKNHIHNFKPPEEIEKEIKLEKKYEHQTILIEPMKFPEKPYRIPLHEGLL